MSDNNKDEIKEKKYRKTKITIMIIIIIIIILLLITSCTSGFWGRIGGAFNNEVDKTIEPDSGEDQIILNKDLKFNTDQIEFNISDENAKISFSYKNINPNKFTCSTSDANIAICYVENDYVVVVPKGTGKVDIILETKVNGKTYRASAKANIKESNRSITLSKTKGTINLYGSKTLLVSISLNKLNGDIKVTVDNPDIVDAKIVNGALKVTGKKAGQAKVTVSVEYDGQTYSTTLDITVVDEAPTNNIEKSDSSLKSLTTSAGSLKFNKNTKKYNLSVPNDTDKLTLDAIPNNKNAHVEYKLNGEKIDSLKDLPLKEGTNEVEITVTAEDGTTTTYNITITREANHNNTLDNIEIESNTEDHLNEEFNSDLLNYTMDVPFNRQSLSLNTLKTNPKSKVTYKYNGQIVNSLDNLKLQYGENHLEIIVEDEKGQTKTYDVTIYRPERKIELESNDYNLYMEDGSISIPYSVYEYDRFTDSWVKTDDYNLDDLNITYNGKVKKAKDQLIITPDKKDINKSQNLTVGYADSKTDANINTKIHDYLLEKEANSYEFNQENGGDIIIDTDMFSGDPFVKKQENGFTVICDSLNEEICLEITGDVEVKYEAGNRFLALQVKSNKLGKHNLHVKGTAYGNTINEFDININIVTEYFVTLYANGGYFDDLNKTTEIRLKVEKGSKIKLSDYPAYKIVENDECKQYQLVGYSLNADAEATDPSIYPLTEELEITDDIELYAIFSEEIINEEIEEDKWLYLDTTDEEEQLFHNEEYFNEYGIDKMIYPGANGTYLMHLDNNSGKNIIIKKIELTETKTICIDENKKQCINMGYKIVSGDTYYYGTETEYTILHENSSTTSNMDLEVPNGSSIDILLKWEWVDFEDEVDTAIGNSVSEINNEYGLLVGINYSSIPLCEVEP